MTETIDCPVCDEANPAGHAYCESCGGPLEGAEHTSSDDETPFPDETPLPEESSMEEDSFDEFDAQSDEGDFDTEDDAGFQTAPSSRIIKRPEFEGSSTEAEEEFEEQDDVEEQEFFGDELDEVEEHDNSEEQDPFDEQNDIEHNLAEETAFDEEAGFDEAQLNEIEADLGIPADEEASLEEEVVPDTPDFVAHRTTERSARTVTPLPTPGPYSVSPSLVIFRDQTVIKSVEIDADRTILGRGSAPEEHPPPPRADEAPELSDEMDETGDEFGLDDELEMDAESAEEWPIADAEHTAKGPAHIDLSDLGNENLAANHIAIYRQNKNYTLYVFCDGATQLNDDLLPLGEHRTLQDGDVIVLGGATALRFELSAA